MIRGAAIAVAVLLLLLVVLKASCSGYDSRAALTEPIGESATLRAKVEEFYRQRRALPGAGDSGFVLAPPRSSSARRIEWDPATRMVVITMDGQPYPGKRFGYEAQVREGGIEWNCRPIDIESKYLPAACR